MIKRTLKTVYRALPFKKSIFDFIKLFWLPPKRITQHLYFNGFFFIAVDKQNKFRFLAHSNQIDNELYWYGLYGGWERYSQRLWVMLCRDADVIIDVGANDGLYSLAAWKVNPQAKIVAAEPLDFVLKRLYQNIEINQAYEIEIQPIAFSNYQGTAEMFVPKGSDYVSSATVNMNLLDRQEDKVDKVEIKVDTLSNYAETKNISKIDLIKMDVESHEPEVLEGMGDLLKIHKPSFIMEVGYERVPNLLNDILDGLGYLYFNINEKTESVRLQDKLTLSDSDNFLICQPEVAKRIGLISQNEINFGRVKKSY